MKATDRSIYASGISTAYELPPKHRVYFHLDVETTSLDASTGHIRSIGWVVTDGMLTHLADDEFSVPVHPSLWDPQTYQWACKTYGYEWRQDLELHSMATDQWFELIGYLLGPLMDTYNYWSKAGHEVWLICNHPDFDATFLRSAFKLWGAWEFPFKHNRILDLGSMLMASCYTEQRVADEYADEYDDLANPKPVAHTTSEIYAAMASKDPSWAKEAVSHGALDDAWRQLNALRMLEVRLPL